MHGIDVWKGKREKYTAASMLEDISTMFQDVSGYLVSPFFTLQILSREEAEKVSDIGAVGMLIGAALEEIAQVVRKKGIDDFKFTLLAPSSDGKYYPISKQNFIELAKLMEQLHRKGLKHYLNYTPDASGFIREKYVEAVDPSVNPLISWDIELGVPLITDRYVLKARIYKDTVNGVKAEKTVKLYESAPTSEKEAQEYTREEIVEILKNYDPSKAVPIHKHGPIEIKKYDGKLFAEYHLVITRKNNTYIIGLGSPQIIEPGHRSLNEIIEMHVHNAVFNIRSRGYDPYIPLRVVKKQVGNRIEITYIALLRKR